MTTLTKPVRRTVTLNRNSRPLDIIVTLYPDGTIGFGYKGRRTEYKVAIEDLLFAGGQGKGDGYHRRTGTTQGREKRVEETRPQAIHLRDVSEDLRVIQAVTGWTQQRVAMELDVASGTVWSWLHGHQAGRAYSREVARLRAEVEERESGGGGLGRAAEL